MTRQEQTRTISPVTTPRPDFLSSLSRAFKRVGRPFTVTEQNGEFKNALHMKETAATVGVLRTRFAMVQFYFSAQDCLQSKRKSAIS